MCATFAQLLLTYFYKTTTMKTTNPLCRLVFLILIFGTTALVNLGYAQTSLIPSNSTWKYLDDGSNQGTSWIDSAFNDGSWSSGAAVLGYGGVSGATVATTVSYGPSSTNKYVTTYFRKQFSLSNPDYTNIYLDLLCDDGAIIYINGKQAYSYNMPGSWSYTTYASSAIGGADEGDYTTYTIPDTFLINGVNTIAVELHNASAGSSDLGFDLAISAEYIDDIFSKGGIWNYLDDGSNLGTSWIDSGYNHTSWSSGNAVLGYGTIDGATVTTTVAYGPSSTAKYATTYFRKEITISNPSYSHLDIDLLCDDGAVIYINGKKALTYNMPTTYDYSTYVGNAVGGTDEGDYTTYRILDSFLIDGVNTFAVEIHQADGSSSDLGFDMSIAGKNLKTAYGRLFMDLDASGTFTAGDEHGSGAIEIYLYNDVDSNGVYTQAELIDSTLTDPLGYWTISFTDTFRHAAIVMDENDLESSTILTTSTEYTFITDTLSSDSLFGYFGMLGPRSLCLLVADNQNGNNVDQYYMVNRLTGKNQHIAEIEGITDIEAIAVKLGMDTVWAFNGAQLGWLDLQTGAFNSVGSGLGSGDGTIGGSNVTHSFTDLDGMAFDALNDVLYATEANASGNDLLVAVNRNTGALIQDFFGSGVDYVEITGTNIKENVDDIAFNPITHELLASNNASNGDSSRYISIDPATGVGTVIADIGAGDFEGMGYYNSGELYGTTGILSKTGYPANSFYQINRNTGVGTKVDSLYSGADDVEACGCLTGPSTNMITGVVFYDVDSSGTYDSEIDSIESSVIVHLYRDANSNGTIDAGDYIIDSAYSNGANGIYLFLVDSLGDFLTRPYIFGTPLQTLNVTTNDSLEEEASFVNYGEVDGKNDFGFHISAGGSPILPVDFIEINAVWQANDAKITWITASEENTELFEIEKSTDNKNYQTVGSVSAAGNSVILNEYQFIDALAYTNADALTYYRIKEIDHDGELTYSAPVALTKTAKETISAYPNPFADVINIEIEGSFKHAELSLINAIGVTVSNKVYQNGMNMNTTINNLKELPSGIYYLRIEVDQKVKLVKLIK